MTEKYEQKQSSAALDEMTGDARAEKFSQENSSLAGPAGKARAGECPQEKMVAASGIGGQEENADAPVLMAKGLNLWIRGDEGEAHILKDVDLSIRQGERWGIVGESGAGKSMTMYAFTALLPRSSTRMTGEILYREPDGSYTDLLGLSYDQRHRYCADKVSLILQDSINALNPFERIEKQFAETIRLHEPGIRGNAVTDHIIDQLDWFGIVEPEEVMKKYPHQLSGGMKQRISIALALESKARILICDEPTTSLDSINQRKVVEFIESLCDREHLTMLYITHNLGITRAICDHTAVLRYGEVIEQGLTEDVFGRPKKPYTQKLMEETSRLWSEGGFLDE